MPFDLSEAMDEHEKSGRKKTVIDIGDTVVCDLCNRDFTHSDETGGLLLLRSSRCPECAPETLRLLRETHEERYAVINRSQTFREFVLEARGGNNKVTITSE